MTSPGGDLAYLARLHPSLEPIFLELEQHGKRDGIPIVDRATGRLLSVLVHAMQSNRILELGTAYGYSTLWMAHALPPAGRIWTVDPDHERTAIARGYFERAGLSRSIEIVNQPALDFLRSAPQRHFDIVFIDAVKAEYTAYLDQSLPLLKMTGLVVVDNLLWSGAAAAAPQTTDTAQTRSIRAFNEHFLNHPQLDATIVPVGDGIGLASRIL